jgi:hypothetical protein
MRKRILILALLLLAMPALAADESAFGQCGMLGAASAPNDSAYLTISRGGASCFYFNADDNSPIFRVVADTALICLNPNLATDGSATGEVMIRKCLPGVTTYSANHCMSMLDASLDGTAGASATQNSCLRVSRGKYIVVNTTSTGGHEAQVSIEGE